MRLSKLLIPVAISLSVILYFSCQKTPDSSLGLGNEYQFFTIPGNTHPIVKNVSQKIFQQNQRYRFVNGLVKRTGFPVWNKSIISSKQINNNITGRGTGGGQDTSMVYIPFVKTNDNYVNSILMIRITDSDTIFRLLYAEEYVNFGFNTTS